MASPKPKPSKKSSCGCLSRRELCAAALAVVSCGAPPADTLDPVGGGTPDGGLLPDGGVADAGVQRDAGSANDDAGMSNDDAGMSNDDAGTTNDDAGTTNDDAGTTSDDAGTTSDDAGTTNDDAGMTSDDAGTANDDAGTTNDDAGTSNDDAGTDDAGTPGGGNPDFVYMGALLQCSYGSSPSVLVVNGRPQSQANVFDFLPIANIQPFTMCLSIANPSVASATAANMGVLTPAPCVPATNQPWQPGDLNTPVDGAPALTRQSTCNCNYAGLVRITTTGTPTP